MKDTAIIDIVMVMGAARQRGVGMGATQERFDVGGMSCSFCAGSIRKAYGRTEGVEDVDVSLAHEEVLVQYDDEVIGEVELKDTLRDLGYTVRDPEIGRAHV